MAITPTALEAALDGAGAQQARVLRSDSDGTNDYNLVAMNAQAHGRTRWFTTTRSDNAATQAASIIADAVQDLAYTVA